jgi:hypothetical protein
MSPHFACCKRIATRVAMAPRKKSEIVNLKN